MTSTQLLNRLRKHLKQMSANQLDRETGRLILEATDELRKLIEENRKLRAQISLEIETQHFIGKCLNTTQKP